jgi:acetyl-CoA carboxylase biotin carboxyl carrier protein
MMTERADKKRPLRNIRGDTVADASKTPGPFDVKTVGALVALMSEHDLSEIDLRQGEERITLRRGSAMTMVAAPAAMPTPVIATAPAHSPSISAKSDGPPASTGKKLIDIKSPTPGTFYGASSPDAQPFVRAGSKVTPTTVVCLIEAMKIFNEITAECAGTIAEILAENQQAVEYGQVLFRVDPAG